ncbi:MAG: glycosyl hydrolase family 28-related protein, partial [Bacteroidota bacterium]
MQVDSTELVVLDTNGMYLHGELTLQHGLGVNSISKEISLSKADSVLSTSGAVRGFVSQRSYSSVMEYGATGDGVTDDSEALTKAIMANPHGTLFVPDGVYVANIRVDTPVTLISHSGNVVFKSNQMGKAVLAVHAPVNLHKLRFEHSDSTTNGSDGLWNYGHDINAYDCTFVGHEINATGDASYSRFSNCTFTTRDAGMTTPPSFGTIAWSANSRFDNCLFDGTYGADVQDSDFYHCTFDARWGIHMPDGKISNNGSASGFEGDGEFHHCTIIGREFYAIGIGNDAHPKLYNCTVVGHASAAYARTQSTYEAYNCFFKATKLFGGSSVLVMSKWPTATHSNIGLVGSGDSYFSNCTFSGGQFHLNIPDREDAGKLYFTNCTYDANRIYVDQQTSGNGDKNK